MATNNPPYNSPEGRELLAKPTKPTRLKFSEDLEAPPRSGPVCEHNRFLASCPEQHEQHEANASPFDSVKVFSATKHNDRNTIGELITDWIRAHPGIEIVDKVVTQSSDSEFHCITITLFYRSAS